LNNQNILSIDVEDFYHAEYVNKPISNEKLLHNKLIIKKIINLLNQHDSYATFFIVGELLEAVPCLIDLISESGHEIAFHSWNHLNLHRISSDIFLTHLKNFLKLYPKCKGFRAPSFSIDEHTSWVFKHLTDNDFLYDSSLFPVKTPLYGSFSYPLYPFKMNSAFWGGEADWEIWEFPISVYRMGPIRIPSGGGFYFRLFPKLIELVMEQRMNEGYPGIFYFHSWEFEEIPKKVEINLFKSFVSYYNIQNVFQNFIKMLERYEFTSFERYLSSME